MSAAADGAARLRVAAPRVRRRARHRIRPDVREKLKKLPKRRGYNFQPIKGKPSVVNVSSLEAMFSAGETITPALLVERGLVRASRTKARGHALVKVLADGELTKKLVISGCFVSKSAREKIEQAGGSVDEQLTMNNK